ncbi:MAG TPA: aldose 1-epimerase [Solirubrobacteraceae bacterium]|nr:aldose 1-epimerase [Solirubrobacteraceae bacterium]
MKDSARTVVLDDEESGLRAKWVPEAGMVCASLTHLGEELVAQNEGLGAYEERGKTMGIPLLYPWANRLAGWSYEVADKSVTIEQDRTLVATDGKGLPIHGVIGGRQSWKVEGARGRTRARDTPQKEHRSPTGRPAPGASGPQPEHPPVANVGFDGPPADGPRRERPLAGHQPGHDRLTAVLAWTADQKDLFGVFPFEHEVHYEAELAGGALTVTIAVEACGEDKVPVAFGFHPYLSLPGAERERYEIELPRMRRLKLDERQIPEGQGEWSGRWRGTLADNVWDDGYGSLSEPAAFVVQAAGRRIEMTFLKGYPCAQTYAPKAGRFVCFEPMTAPANALRSGEGLEVLAPGERYAASWRLMVLDVEPGA